MDSHLLSLEEISKVKFLKAGKNLKISSNAIFIGSKNISIGNNVRIDDFTIIVAAKGKVEIGNNVHISAYNYINGSGIVEIGNYCNFSQGCRIYSKSDNYDGTTLTNPTFHEKFTKPIVKKVKILEHCIFGSGTIILPGCKISTGVAVGALSLIKDNLKSWRVYGGSPARFLKERSKIKIKDLKKALKKK
jgi:dTDP-4-amino-4,6-dideoxy-D-glucose acyltransferase